MTRPPDFDLTTVEGIVRTVEAMTFARKVALFSTESSVTSAAKHATEAAHHARRLQGVAELLAASWRCPDCAEREGA